MPAMLPDGTLSDRSVSHAVVGRDVQLGRDPQGVVTVDLGTGERIDDGAGDRVGRPGHRGEWSMNPSGYIFLAVILFVIGAIGVLVRRNAILIFLSVELMLNSCNLAFVSFSRLHGNLDGQVVAFFVMVVAAAEVVVGLAILMAIYRARKSASVDDANLLKN